MQLSISGYSTALFSTWYFIEELRLLFDCGDGITAALLQKSRKIDHIFITHADRDHLTGLLQMLQLNAREGAPKIYYPKDCGSFPALQHFSGQFDPHVNSIEWLPISSQDRIWIKKDVYVEAIKNHHVPGPEEQQKSLGYKVVQVKEKLKPEYVHLPGTEIRNLILQKGKAAIHTTVPTTLLAYSGDTPCENFDQWNEAQVLIHEATFLGLSEDAAIHTHGNKHSNLTDVIKAIAQTNVKALILGHFSSRYSPEAINRAVQTTCEEYQLNIPVYTILPGQTVFNVLQKQPVINSIT